MCFHLREIRRVYRWIVAVHALSNAKPDVVWMKHNQLFLSGGKWSSSDHLTNVSFLAPTHPREVEVKALKGDELLVTWKAPSKPNGNVTHYYVYWQPQPLSREKLDQRNYCKDSESKVICFYRRSNIKLFCVSIQVHGYSFQLFFLDLIGTT